MTAAQQTLRTWAEAQDWGAGSQLALCLHFINGLGTDALTRFQEFLSEYADEENRLTRPDEGGGD